MLRYLTFSMLCIQFLGLFCSAELDAWHADIIHPLADEQLDPIMNPNSMATHMHTIIGGSAFAASYDYDTYANAKCSTVQIQADKSNYWVPALYMYDPSWGSKPFISVKSNMRFYYFLSRNSVNEPVAAFPKGLRTMAGSPDNRSPQPYASYGCQVNKDLTGALKSSGFNFPSSCPYGLVASLYFPQCWDGLNLWLPNSAHMSYPAGDNIRYSPCPMSHPIRVPLIMLEVTWTPQGIAPGVPTDGKLTFATGDMTGYSLHGDFVNGWDVDLLSKALNTTGCVGTDAEIAIEECPVFGRGTPYYNPSAAAACKPERGVLQEPAGNGQQLAYANLPGANAPPGLPIPTPAALNVAPFTGTDGAYQVPAGSAQNLVWPTTPGWASMGCVKSPGLIANVSNFLDSKLTPERCQAACGSSNKPISVIGSDYYGQTKCYCGNSISDQTEVAPLMCTSPCAGDSTKTCGGKEAYEVFYAPPGTESPTSNATSLGCLTNTNNGLLTKATYSFRSFAMTTEVCMQACVDRNATWGLTTDSQRCACGTDYTLGSDTYVPSDFCTSTCSGNTTEFCGSAYRSSVFNLTAAGITAAERNHPAGYQGCYTKPSSGVALSNTSWSSNTMTIGACVDGCSSLGNTYAAVSDGKVCLCGDKPNLGATLPASQCTAPCAGNANNTCGGGLQVELYLTKNSSVTPQLTTSKYSSDWMGCYADPAGSTSLSSYVFTSSSMTQALCKSGCTGFNYTFAGLTNGNTCGCSKTPSTTKMVPAALCAVKCTGNSSATCGGGGYSDIYNVTDTAVKNTTLPAASGYQGCYQDNSARGLNSYSWTNNKMTTEMCRTGCQSLNYTLAGTQNGNSCFCGNQWKAGGILPDLSCATSCNGDKTQKCGGGWISSVYSTASAPSYPARPAGWMGCYSDSVSARSLPAYMFSGGMTIEVCRATCSSKGYKLAGVQNGNQCFCDNAIVSPKPAPVTLCASPCSLNSTAVCGGSGAMDIYSANTQTPVTTGKPGHLGCFKDWGPSTLYRFASDMLSPAQCNQVCIVRGYKFSSLLNGNACQCGNTPATTLTTANQCSSPCVGSKNETCGASNAVDAYDLSKIADTTGKIVANPDKSGYMGCFVNSLGPVLDTKLFSSSRMTNDLCVSSCRELGFSLAATFSTNNCYCGNSLNSTTADYQVQDSNCNSVCNGDNTKKCGGPYHLSVYNVASYSTASNVTAPALAEGAKGCFAAGTAISAPPYKYSVGGMTTSLCRRTCRNKGFSIAALSNGNTCSCSSTPIYGPQQPSALCSTGCAGQSSEMCGTSTTVNVYDTTGAGSLPAAGSPANYVGCFGAKDADGKPTLSSYTSTSAAMTPGMCSSICAGKGFSVSGTGLASGSTCYCGTAYPPTLYTDAVCSWTCAGDRSQNCGNSYLFSLYDTKSSNANANMRIASVPSSSAQVSNSSSSSMTASNSSSISRLSTSTTASITASSLTNISSSVSKPGASTSASGASVTGNATVVSVSSSVSKPGASTSASGASVTGNATVVSAVSSSATVNSSLSMTSSRSAGITTTSLVPSSSSSAASVSASIPSSSTSSISTSTLVSKSSSAQISFSTSISSSSVGSSTSNVMSSSVSSSSAATPTATTKGLTYAGCYVLPPQVNTTSVFNSTTLNITNTIVTPDSCWSWCSDKRFDYSAITNGTTCLCTMDITTLIANSKACSSECQGLTGSSCGGPTSFSIWKYVMPQRRRHWRDLTVGRD